MRIKLHGVFKTMSEEEEDKELFEHIGEEDRDWSNEWTAEDFDDCFESEEDEMIDEEPEDNDDVIEIDIEEE